VQINLLTRDRDAGHDLTARLAKALVLPEEPVTMKRVLVEDDALPALALRVEGEVHAISHDASEADLLELPEVKHFLRVFGENFSLSLDELSS
jgi:hypothetical protein